MELTATQTRVRQHEDAQTRALLASSPDLLVERIANHYASLATVAMQLAKVIQHEREAKSCEMVDCSAISDYKMHLLLQTVEKHRQDFGIMPAWRYLA